MHLQDTDQLNKNKIVSFELYCYQTLEKKYILMMNLLVILAF